LLVSETMAEVTVPLEGVLFDVDGTIVDSNDAHARAWRSALAAGGFVVPYDAVRRRIGMGGDKLLPDLTGLDKDDPRAKEITAHRRRIFLERELPTIRAFPGARDLLERLRQDGLRRGVASSAEREELARVLEQAGLDHLLRIRTSSSDADRSKPDPDIVEAALQEVGIRPDRSLMIGDTPYDVQAAARAGVPAVGFRCGGWTDGDLRGAIAVYDGPADLLARHASSPLAASTHAERVGQTDRL
jgi:HAD superfamily hydrolase (TIGR01509 family)